MNSGYQTALLFTLALLCALGRLLQACQQEDGCPKNQVEMKNDTGKPMQNFNPHKQIRIDVLEKYIPAIPINNDGPMEVVMNLQMVMLVDVNEPEEAIVLNGWIMIFWTDDSIRWDASRYNSTVAEFPSTTKLWVPDVTWYERIPMVEAYEGDAGIFSGARAVVRHNGQIYISRGLLMKSHCSLSIQNFPFDRQECNFTFSSNIHTTERLVLRAVDNRRESLTDTAGWTMLGFPTSSYNKTFSGVGTFTRVVFTLKMRRKPMFFIFYLMLPSFLISVLSSLVFLLPPHTSEKIPFCVNILLSLTVSMMIMTDMTPPTEEVPLLSIYFFVVLVLSMLNSAATIIIENVYDTTGTISCLMTKLCVKRRNGSSKSRDSKQNGAAAAAAAAAKRRLSPIRSDRTTSSAQAANLAHYYETEESETYCNHIAWHCPGDCDTAIDAEIDTDAEVDANANADPDAKPMPPSIPLASSSACRRRRRGYVTPKDRLRAVKRLNRICFTISISIAVTAPIVFTAYGLSVFPNSVRHSRVVN